MEEIGWSRVRLGELRLGLVCCGWEGRRRLLEELCGFLTREIEIFKRGGFLFFCVSCDLRLFLIGLTTILNS